MNDDTCKTQDKQLHPFDPNCPDSRLLPLAPSIVKERGQSLLPPTVGTKSQGCQRPDGMKTVRTAYLTIVCLACVGIRLLFRAEGDTFRDLNNKDDGIQPHIISVEDNRETLSSGGVPPYADVRLCFLASVFGQWAANADRLQNVTRLPFYDNPMVHFFAFTNMPNMKAPGWQKVIRKYPQYERYITQSRVPKFLGWQDPTVLENCDVIFYMDSIGHIIGNFTDFQLTAREILASQQGHAQYLHRGGGGAFGEFRRIEVFDKDSLENIRASKKWLNEQPDFDPNCTLYENRYIGYAINSTSFHQAAEFLWDRYSLEKDSWRDQPLWW